MKYADSQIDDANSPQPLKLEILSNESSVYKQESNSINYPKIDENNDN